MLMWIESTILVTQILILAAVVGSTWHSFQTRKNIGEMLKSLYGYRREIAWLTARLDTLEQGQQKAKGQGNVGVEASRGK
jgi:hypothetical protein